MSLATSIRSLVEDIKTSKNERQTFVKDTARHTHELLGRFNKELHETARELKEAASDLKKFLANSEKNRQANFIAFWKTLLTRLTDLRNRTRALLKEYNSDRSGAHKIWFSLGASETPKPRAKKAK